jgi:hypothetical protein
MREGIKRTQMFMTMSGQRSSPRARDSVASKSKGEARRRTKVEEDKQDTNQSSTKTNVIHFFLCQCCHHVRCTQRIYKVATKTVFRDKAQSSV